MALRNLIALCCIMLGRPVEVTIEKAQYLKECDYTCNSKCPSESDSCTG